MNVCKILLVDDEPHILAAYQRTLRRSYEINATTNPLEALLWLDQRGPFAVVCSDMRMPEMDGAQFLEQVRRVAPDTMRIMLTGNLDQATAASAVNAGKVFQFLNKPCSPEVLAQAIGEAVRQYQLINSEKELLSKTLTGSVSLLTEVLSMVNPIAFGKAARIKQLVSRICEQMRLENAWEVTVAAMLCQVGCVTISERTLAKVNSGIVLSPKEEESLANHAAAGERLIAKVPRLHGVAKMVGRQNEEFDPLRECPPGHESIWLGADILKAVLDFDELTVAGAKPELALRSMAERAGIYNPSVLNALMEAYSVSFASKTVDVSELKDGMILEEHLTNSFGEILVVQGQEITSGLRERLRSLVDKSVSIKPVRVLCPWLQVSREPASA
jgi:response regulator RpfG family c-di-GMP phosphodiesterase